MESTKTTAAKAKLEPERANFHSLLAKNPNYFGSNPGTKLKPVKEIAFAVSYEELVSVGYNPDTRTLEATLAIKQAAGYDGPLCGSGSSEFVRFYMNYGSGWVDQGMVAVNVHDIPTITDCEKDSTKPLNYTVTLPIQPQSNNCKSPVIPLVRAILSWEIQPTPNTPDFPVVWGNKMERHVQIKPYLYDISVLGEAYVDTFFSIAQSSSALSASQINQAIAVTHPEIKSGIADAGKQVMSLKDLSVQYAKDKKVTAARYGFSHLQAALNSPVLAAQYKPIWQNLNLDWDKYLGELLDSNADIAYEELESVGLDYNLERFIATFRIKQSIGYSGNLCTAGSKEYITFWADWDNTCDWAYVGTVAVDVHDIASIPKDGISYSAILPVDLTYHRDICSNPKVVRIRAVLSWESPSSKTDPNELNYWGNRLDTHIQIKPGVSINPGDVVPIIVVLGGIPTDKIDSSSGLTTPDAFFALSGLAADPLGRACPFGGRVVIQGPSFPGYTYRIQVRPVGTIPWTNVVTPLTLTGWQLTPPYVIYTNSTPDVDGFFTFQDPSKNIDNVLGWWDVSGSELWEVKLEIPLYGEVIKRIQLEQSVPDAEISIDNGGNCKDFSKGDVIQGHFVARANYFGEFSLQADLDPVDISIYDETVPAPGHGWKIDTSTWAPCGYTIYVSVWDRTILNSGPGAHYFNQNHVGFCLRAK